MVVVVELFCTLAGHRGFILSKEGSGVKKERGKRKRVNVKENRDPLSGKTEPVILYP